MNLGETQQLFANIRKIHECFANNGKIRNFLKIQLRQRGRDLFQSQEILWFSKNYIQLLLDNKILLAEFGFDTTGNEPRLAWGIIWSLRARQGMVSTPEKANACFFFSASNGWASATLYRLLHHENNNWTNFSVWNAWAGRSGRDVHSSISFSVMAMFSSIQPGTNPSECVPLRFFLR